MLVLQLHVCKVARLAGLACCACAGVHVTQLGVFSSWVYFNYPVEVMQPARSKEAKPYLVFAHIKQPSQH
jgi:hypothetical protein